MKRALTMLCAAMFLFGCQHTNKRDNTHFVDPFIGTGGHGHTFPGATRPFSMIQLSPDTHLHGWDACSGYHDSDSVIYAFSHTHLSGTGIGDLGDIGILPYSGSDTLRNPVATFSKSSEVATPGYYKVHIENYDITAELTSTERVGMHRYSYANKANRQLMLNLNHVLQPNWGHKFTSCDLTIVSNEKVEGVFRTQGWAHFHEVPFVISFAEPTKAITVTENEEEKEWKFGELIHSEKDVKVYFSFDTSDAPLLVKVAISPADCDGAEKNMTTELPGWDFDKIKSESHKKWCEALNAIEIESRDTAVLKNFYTALYHSMVAPILWQDVDGRYKGMDKEIHTAPAGYTNYTVFSLWDTFRAWHPLMTIINPDQASKWGDVLVQGYKEGTILPKWPLASNYTGCMIGYPALSVLADLHAKGLMKGDINLWSEAALRSSVYRPDLAEKFKGTWEAHAALKYPMFRDKYGFIPADSISESVSWALEMAYEDWCVAQLAKAAGDDDNYGQYMYKSGYWKKYLDPQTHLMRPVLSDGTFRSPFNPYYSAHNNSDYCEGTPFQWGYFVPHDMDGFINELGGKDKLKESLDRIFNASSVIEGETASKDISGLIGQYAHGNEPSHHIAYLYNWTNAPEKGQDHLDYIMRNFYKPTPDGIIGNEDVGQMSAWYILSSLGFYQVCPGIPTYALGRPLIDHAWINVPKGKFEIVVRNNSPEKKYIKQATINGHKLTAPFFEHKDIKAGGRLEIEMTDKIQ